ncbi:hypothetical protein PVAP13_5NG125905 [Panicum virgatum]|uniref:Uncharacterized protein n=1 Tax=Panicum virgatum TaxID=38727 RepID=A0A8T0RRP3_PANVG|nr:hypothetical protein PVAP13_5NG125905 [Panicum virgatum]
MQAAANRRPGRNSAEEAARPLRRRRRHCLGVPAIIVMYLVCVCLHGDANLQAAAVRVPRRGPRSLLAGAGSRVVVGSRPIPAVVGAGGSSPSASAAGARFGDDKRRIPSCPDALHNR